MEKNSTKLLTSIFSSFTEYFLKVSKAPSSSALVTISLKRATTFTPQEGNPSLETLERGLKILKKKQNRMHGMHKNIFSKIPSRFPKQLTMCCLMINQPISKPKWVKLLKVTSFKKKTHTHYNKMNEPLILSTIKYIQDSSENSPNLVE